jgi:hypothetical protein
MPSRTGSSRLRVIRKTPRLDMMVEPAKVMLVELLAGLS